jgi:cytochrome P450
MTGSLPAILNEPFPWPRLPLDPPPAYGALRDAQPVTRVTLRSGQPAWLVTRYDDVRAILTDPRVSADSTKAGYPTFGVERPADHRSFHEMDPPEHTILRRLLTKEFLVRRIELMRPDMQALVEGLIDQMLASPLRPFDLVQGLALPVPSTVISWLLGVPAADRTYFSATTETLMKNAGGVLEANRLLATQALKALRDYIAKIVAEKQQLDDPGADILGELVKASRQGITNEQDAINTGALLIVAGHDTTANMISLGVLTLLQHHDQLDELRRDPALIPAAVEEMLRYLTVVHLIIRRVATEDIELGGQVIPAGEAIIPLNFSANRDDAHFPDAAAFDIHRKPRDHFAFGHGIHQCIGQSLARVELHVVFEALLRRVPTLRLAGSVEAIPFKLTASIHGVSQLPVSW